MSGPTRRGARYNATIKPKVETDKWGRPVGDAPDPYDIKCCFEVNTSKRFVDSEGSEFTPRTIFYYELPTQGMPKLGDKIILNGDEQEIKSAQLVPSGPVGGPPNVMLATQ